MMDREPYPWEEDIKKDIEEKGAKASTTGKWIKEYLKDGRADYLNNMYRKYKEFIEDETNNKPLTYQSFTRYARELRKLGLIEETDTERPTNTNLKHDRKYHRAVKERLGDPRWNAPFKYSQED